jgi:hypothetical protein
MKKVLVLVLFFLVVAFSPNNSNVYICGPHGAKKYNYSDTCRGLSACKHEIVKVSLSNAQDYGLTLCGWED